MFSMLNSRGLDGGDAEDYDFTKGENAARWTGLFLPSLRKVLEQAHPHLSAEEDALLHIEGLCLRLLRLLCAKPTPHNVHDVEEVARRILPTPIGQWALTDAKKKRKPVFPTDRIHSILQKDVFHHKIDSSVSSFLVTILEYISADILKVAGDYVSKIKHTEITKEDVEVVLNADKVFMDMFNQSVTKPNNLISPTVLSAMSTQSNLSYEGAVRELIKIEQEYQRDLNMIIRVFREELVKITPDPNELEAIFSNILDIYEVSTTLLSSLEDVIDILSEQGMFCVGSCFEELAEAEEFDVYSKYAHEVTSHASKQALSKLLARPEAQSLITAGHGFRDAVKYYLPKLLLTPVFHAFVYFDYIKLLKELSSSPEDIESFEQVQGLLHPLRCELETIIADLPKPQLLTKNVCVRRNIVTEKIQELQAKVEQWDPNDSKICDEFIREDFLGKQSSGKRLNERKVYLFDGIMCLCKPINPKKQITTVSNSTYEYRVKEKFYIKRSKINDRVDTDELKYSFEIASRDQQAIIFSAKCQQHKEDWMADLIKAQTKSMLEHTLDSILRDLEQKHPLRLPSTEVYRFAESDSPSNIILEHRQGEKVPLVKAATLCKLIEWLTHHIYFDAKFVRCFLATYRYFCSPVQLLELLIERFNMPDPASMFEDSCQDAETDKFQKYSEREDMKRYRKNYFIPVRTRVVYVLRSWTTQHFYDFQTDAVLFEKSFEFLNGIDDKSLRRYVASCIISLTRKRSQIIIFPGNQEPPPIENHLNVPEAETTILTLHPLELARQMTLLEYEMYNIVKPSELVGSPWTKKDQELKSPNLLKIMKHTTTITRWIERSVIEAENYEERVAVVLRVIEIMIALNELNNFNGILSITAALDSASVYRLKHTFQGLPVRYEKMLDECREFNKCHLKKYQERLRMANPPCVPFFGQYLTHIIHLEDGNPDLMPNTELINFYKRRRVAEIILEIQQFQGHNYCLQVEPKIRHFLETLDPNKGLSDADLESQLYEESLRLEPRDCLKPPKFPRKWPSIPLKSPGIKPKRQAVSKSSQNMQTLQTQTQISAEPEVSSPGGGSQSKDINSGHGYSVFAVSGTPERNGMTWLNTESTLPGASNDQFSTETAPNLPKKPSPHVWTSSGGGFVNEAFHSSSTELPTPPPCNRFFEDSINTSNNNAPETTENLSSFHRSPLPRVVLTPRNESNSSSDNQASPLFSGAKLSAMRDTAPTASSSLLDDTFFSSQSSVVPISPHVNVPTTLSMEYRIMPPPPLPPRRKERTASCADLAQKRQAADAPLLPPRDFDTECNPPPIPPRITRCHSSRIASSELIGKNSLLLPNTSSIMIRRNSAIEKRCNTVGNKLQPPPLSKPLAVINNITHFEHNEQQPNAPSPALSSSTTTSPMTPMTPISPYTMPDNVAYQQTQVSFASRRDSVQSLQAPCPVSSHYSIPEHDVISAAADFTQPKLPPKPSLMANFHNNPQRATMFLYPSTNPEQSELEQDHGGCDNQTDIDTHYKSTGGVA